MLDSMVRSVLTFAAAVSIAVALRVAVSTSHGQSEVVEEAVTLGPLVYSDIRTLRVDLHLTTDELAAVGANESAASQALTDLLEWCEINQTVVHRQWLTRAHAKAWRCYHVSDASQASALS